MTSSHFFISWLKNLNELVKYGTNIWYTMSHSFSTYCIIFLLVVSSGNKIVKKSGTKSNTLRILWAATQYEMRQRYVQWLLLNCTQYVISFKSSAFKFLNLILLFVITLILVIGQIGCLVWIDVILNFSLCLIRVINLETITKFNLKTL